MRLVGGAGCGARDSVSTQHRAPGRLGSPPAPHRKTGAAFRWLDVDGPKGGASAAWIRARLCSSVRARKSAPRRGTPQVERREAARLRLHGGGAPPQGATRYDAPDRRSAPSWEQKEEKKAAPAPEDFRGRWSTSVCLLMLRRERGWAHPESFTPNRPATSCTYCQATRPEREPRVVDHSSASRRRVVLADRNLEMADIALDHRQELVLAAAVKAEPQSRSGRTARPSPRPSRPD